MNRDWLIIFIKISLLNVFHSFREKKKEIMGGKKKIEQGLLGP